MQRLQKTYGWPTPEETAVQLKAQQEKDERERQDWRQLKASLLLLTVLALIIILWKLLH
jgi:hypothetical protein